LVTEDIADLANVATSLLEELFVEGLDLIVANELEEVTKKACAPPF
jgi:hypothetical protein